MHLVESSLPTCVIYYWQVSIPRRKYTFLLFRSKMNFEEISKEILDKVGDSADDLFNVDLIKKIHSFTKDYKWNFDNEDKGTENVTLELASAEKDKGTKFFRSNMLQEACETYTELLKMCHQLPDSEEKNKLIYQGYANR